MSKLITVSGAKNEATIVFTDDGKLAPLPPSAGVPATITKGAASQVIAVHGTTTGIVADIPSGQ
jgi:hypothetical protein